MKKVIIVNIVAMVVAILVPMAASAATYTPVYIDNSDFSSREDFYNSDSPYIEIYKEYKNLGAKLEQNSIISYSFDSDKSKCCFYYGQAENGASDYKQLFCYYLDTNGNLKKVTYFLQPYVIDDVRYLEDESKNHVTLTEKYDGTYSNGGYNGITFHNEDSSTRFAYYSIGRANCPVFSTEEACLNYLVNGVYDGCLNPDDVLPYVFDLEVPKEIDVKYSSGFFDFSPQYKITWTQTDSSYVNWNTEFKVYMDFAWRKAILGISFADWNYVKDNFIINEMVKCIEKSYVVDEDCKLSNNIIDSYLNKIGVSGTVATVDKYVVFMRNRYVGADGKLHLSNWVEVDISDGTGFVHDADEGDIEIRKTEIEGSLSDTLDKPVGNVVIENGYDGSVSGTSLNQNSSDLLGYISSGFGMLGDNGLISLLTKLLSFVPSWFWSIMASAVAILVVVGLIKLVL